jgi:2-methylcitrate dehydratase PrpD
LEDQAVLAMADRVWVKKDDSSAREKEAASVEIRTRGGTVYHRQVRFPLGDDRHNPMSQQQIEDKFRDCASFSAQPISSKSVNKLVDLVGSLERLSDVREITGLLQ